MRRRLFITGTVTVAVGLSGCSGDNAETGADTTGPESTAGTDATGTESTAGTDATGTESTEAALIAVLETHWDAYRDSDVETYVSTFHSESPQRDDEPWNDEGYWGEEDSTFVIESREVAEMGDTTATVNETVRGEVNGNASRWRSIVELRLDDGEWKVWDFREELIDADA